MTDTGGQRPCPECGYEDDQARHNLALPVGTLLNERFHIGRVLGKPGGYGIAYLAFDTVLQSTVAIKEFLPPTLVGRAAGGSSIVTHSDAEAGHFEQALFEFVREARILVRFDHPNIARVRDFFEANGTAYLVMDYYRGQSLQEYLVQQATTLDPERALGLLMPILDGLEAMHRAGYLHRDIKPSNIYLTEDNRPLLLDFGAARQSLGDATQSLSVVVSRSFAPYEQHLRRSRQGPWTDVYALAATLYYTLTAVRPPDALERKEHDDLIPPSAINPRVDGTFERALVAGLAVEPEDRPQSIAAFRDMLAGTRRVEASDEDTPSTVDTPAPARTSAVWLIAGVMSVAVALYVVFSRHNDEPTEAVSLPVPQAPADRADPSSAPQRDRPLPAPPARAFEVCAGAQTGAACYFEAPHGVINGRCLEVLEGLACVPEGQRPPPERHGM